MSASGWMPPATQMAARATYTFGRSPVLRSTSELAGAVQFQPVGKIGPAILPFVPLKAVEPAGQFVAVHQQATRIVFQQDARVSR